MINTVRKGRETELAYKKKKEAEGYTCFKPTKKHRHAKQQDIFGLFDLVCMNKKEVLLVQVKANHKRSPKKIQAFSNHPRYVKKIIAVKKDRGDWKEYIIK